METTATLKQFLKTKNENPLDTDFPFKAVGMAATGTWFDGLVGEGKETELNLDYLTTHGDKICAPLIEMLEDKSMAEINATIADIFLRRFESKFTKMYAVMTAEYNPIENYNRVETTTNSLTEGETGTAATTSALTGTDAAESSGNNSVKGFDSDTWADETKAENTSNSTTSRNGNDSTNTERSRTQSDTTTSNIHGNIGVMSTQQMMEAEMNIRKNILIDEMFKDMDKILTTNIY